MITKTLKCVISVLVVSAAASAHADWHTGLVQDLGHDYGSVTTFRLIGYSRTNCTCGTWPNYICLDRTRVSQKEELALLLSAKAMGRSVSLNMDEVTCKVTAILMDAS